MATRSTRTTKSTVVNAKSVETPKPEAAHEVFGEEDMTLTEKIKAYFEATAEAYGASSTRAHVCGLIAGFFVQCGVGYALWSVMSTLGIVMLLVSGSMFLATLIGIIGLLLALIVSGVAGTYVHKYIASGTAGRHWSLLTGSVTGLFGAKRPIAAC